MPQTVRLRSRAARAEESKVLVGITPRQAGWKYVRFGVRQLAASASWRGSTGADEACFVLLEGSCRVQWNGKRATLGPRRDVFSSYPHALYAPPGTTVSIEAGPRTIIADCRAPARGTHPAHPASNGPNYRTVARSSTVGPATRGSPSSAK